MSGLFRLVGRLPLRLFMLPGEYPLERAGEAFQPLGRRGLASARSRTSVSWHIGHYDLAGLFVERIVNAEATLRLPRANRPS
ncbi:MAG TPA: hypothetical protein VNS34_12260 [Rhizobiaceae bacterium]|nr:hypothetical protein [Rhizobiaceae bacterium]